MFVNLSAHLYRMWKMLFKYPWRGTVLTELRSLTLLLRTLEAVSFSISAHPLSHRVYPPALCLEYHSGMYLELPTL